ncbi:hypothetical protein ATCC90586_007081 [Pythium insidiosum]|nr:hypothetical protein ATCC90586_007081 [Pythium insidiosum]
MKSYQLLTIPACAALVGQVAHVASAAECTAEDYKAQTKLMSTPEFVQACGKAVTAPNVFFFCSVEKCYNYARTLDNQISACTIENEPWRRTWNKALEMCRQEFAGAGNGSTSGDSARKNETTAGAVSTDAPAPTKPPLSDASSLAAASVALASGALAVMLLIITATGLNSATLFLSGKPLCRFFQFVFSNNATKTPPLEVTPKVTVERSNGFEEPFMGKTKLRGLAPALSVSNAIRIK